MLRLDSGDIKTLQNAVRQASKPVVISHVNPDGDAVGSSTAMLSYLLSLGKDARIVLPSEIAATLSFIQDEESAARTLTAEGHKIEATALISAADLIICVDFNTLSRIDAVGDMVRSSSAVKVLIDHHPGPERDAFDLVFSETEVSSASEIVFWILKALCGGADRLPGRSPYALLCGMTTDSNNFGNSTFPSTLEMASELIAAGVDREDILAHIYNSYRQERLRAMAHVLGKMKITDNGVAILTLSEKENRDLGLQEGETEGFVNLPLAALDVRLSIFARQNIDAVRVSLRSKRGTSCNEIAHRYFHGGGHVLASGGKIFIPQDVKNFSSVEDYIKRVTDEYFAEN